MLNKGAFAFKTVRGALKWPLKGGSRLIEVDAKAGLTVHSISKASKGVIMEKRVKRLCHTSKFLGAQWLSGRVLDSRPKVRASVVSLRCVLEQDTLILAQYWFNPGRPVPWYLKDCLLGHKRLNQTNKTSKFHKMVMIRSELNKISSF